MSAAAASVSGVMSLPESKTSFSTCTSWTGAFNDLKRNLPRQNGRRRTKGNCPPSNHNGTDLPVRARWPLVPRPTVCPPTPEPKPLPRRLSLLLVIFGKLCNMFILLYFLNFCCFRFLIFLAHQSFN